MLPAMDVPALLTLHADTAVAAHDRAALERLIRYGASPPFAHRRLRRTATGKVAYRLRRPWSSYRQVQLTPAPATQASSRSAVMVAP